jgi:hypothetical protein
VGEVRLDRERLLRAQQRFMRPVELTQGRRLVGQERRIDRRKLKQAFIGRDGVFHPIEPQQRIAAIAERVGVIRTRCQHALEAFERLPWPPQFDERHAAPIEKFRVVRLKPKPLFEARQRARKIAQRVEDEPEAGEAFGAREIAFQRLLKTRKRRIEPTAAIVDLA